MRASFVSARDLFAHNRFDKAIPQLQTLAQQGYAPAELLLGFAYDFGLGVLIDPNIATSWVSCASNAGDILAVDYQAWRHAHLFDAHRDKVGIPIKLAEEAPVVTENFDPTILLPSYPRPDANANSHMDRSAPYPARSFADSEISDPEIPPEWLAHQGIRLHPNLLAAVDINRRLADTSGDGYFNLYWLILRLPSAKSHGLALDLLSQGARMRHVRSMEIMFTLSDKWEGYLPRDFAANRYEILKEGALEGDPVCQRLLADAFRLGRYHLRQNMLKAFTWYRRAADQGDLESTRILEHLCLDGKEIGADYASAWRYAKRGVEADDTESYICLGVLYLYGYGVPENVPEAVRYLTVAANRGDRWAQCEIGYALSAKKFHHIDLAEALKWLKQAALNGDIWAADQVHTIEDLSAAAGQSGNPHDSNVKGDDSASRALASGRKLLTNTEGQTNPRAARLLFIYASVHGEPDAFTDLGALYEKGIGVQPDPHLAAGFYIDAMAGRVQSGYTALRNWTRQHRLKDFPEIGRRLKALAENNNAYANLFLANLYLTAHPTAESVAKARPYFLAATKDGLASAYAGESLAFLTGFGARRNVAFVHFELKHYPKRARSIMIARITDAVMRIPTTDAATRQEALSLLETYALPDDYVATTVLVEVYSGKLGFAADPEKYLRYQQQLRGLLSSLPEDASAYHNWVKPLASAPISQTPSIPMLDFGDLDIDDLTARVADQTAHPAALTR